MKAKHLLFGISILCVMLLISCIGKKFPRGIKEFSGVIKTCVLDSTSFTQSKKILIISSDELINSDCANKPPDYEHPLSWPATLTLNFSTGKYLFGHSGAPENKEKKFSDPDFRYSWRADVGTIKFNKQQNIIDLHSVLFQWQRSFKILKISNDSLVLESMD